ncbi:hypothetical protein V2J09_022304 [Rumex salicifolius]
MEAIGVQMVHPMSTYLEQELASRFKLFKLWDSSSASVDEYRCSIRAVVCCASAGADAALIHSLPNLEIISSYSVGVDKIDLYKCRERGVRVTNTPDVLTDDVADIAVGLTLATLRRMCSAHRFLTGGGWKNGEYCLTTKLSGKSVGILGLGRIGSAIAKRAQSFGCSISYCSRTQKPHNPDYNYYETTTELASNCDVLVVSCSLTDETRHIVNRQVMDALGPTGVLVNVGRGAHVDEPELVAALLEGRLGGAGLDVFENEPDVPEELFGMENVVVQSHVGSDTVETCKDMAHLVLGNLEAHFMNRPLLTPEMELGWRIVLATIVGFLASSSGSAGGSVGGGLYVAVFFLIVGFDINSSSAMSNLMSVKAYIKGVEAWNKETSTTKEATQELNSIVGSDETEYEPLVWRPHSKPEVQLFTRVQWKGIVAPVAVWIVILALQISKSSVTSCSAAYWVLTLLQIPLCVGAFTYESIKLLQRMGGGGVDGARGHWTACELALCCVTGVVAGAASAMLGVGGGFLLCPLFLHLGISPQVSSATAALAITISSSMSVVEYYLLKRFPLPYAVYFSGVAIVATLVGNLVVNKLGGRGRRASILILGLASTFLLTAVLLGAEGSIEAMNMVENKEYMGFQSLCSYN